MDDLNLVKVATYMNSARADLVCGILEGNGIQAFADGANTNTMMSHVGSALGARVLVPAKDVDRALEIIEAIEEESAVPGSDWYCGRCKEHVEGTFQACWSCGQAREQVQEIPTASVNPQETSAESTSAFIKDSPVLSDESATEPVVANFESANRDRTEQNSGNPFAAPETVEGLAASTEKPSDEIDPEAEEILLRAWRASLIAIVLLPVILNLYSMFLLMQASIRTEKFSPEGQKRFYWAFVMNLIGGALWIGGLFYFAF